MVMSLLMMLIGLMLLMNLSKYIYFFSNSLFIIVFLMISNINFFVDWLMLSMTMSINFYSYGLVVMSVWIMGLVIMMLNTEKNLIYCMYLLMIMLMVLLINFLSLNLLMFYYMFEFSLLLIFLLLVIWGSGSLRLMAGYYLMFYTLFFSLPLLVILFSIVNKNGTESFIILENLKINMNLIMFLFLLMSFLVKLPMFMFHGWLLKAHVEAPVFGSMILAAIMLKLGSYGLLRFMLIFYNNFLEINDYFIELSLIGSIILSLLCFRQIDMKVLVAMSSVVHMGLLLSSMLTMLKLSFLGGYLMMIAHGLCSSGLFYMLNLCYLKTNSRLMIINKGMMIFMPSMSLMWFLLCSSNMAAPFSLNLVSEIMLLISLVGYMKILMIKLFIYCLLSFMYSLYFFSYINHGNYNLFMNFSSGKMINFSILLFHWIPLNLMIFNLNLLI